MKIQKAQQLIEKLLAEHGLNKRWNFRFSERMTSTFGKCSFKRKEIILSAPLVRLASEVHVRNTILHEIAHALAGPNFGHGPRWRMFARKIGSSTSRTYSRDAQLSRDIEALEENKDRLRDEAIRIAKERDEWKAAYAEAMRPTVIY